MRVKINKEPIVLAIEMPIRFKVIIVSPNLMYEMNKTNIHGHNEIGDNMYIDMILKTFFLYFFIMFMYRIMGKKEVGELGLIDLIVSVLIAELAAISIEETNRSIFMSVVPIIVLVFCEVTLSFISMKSEKLRNFFDGKPSVIIKKGKINFSLMTKIRYTLDDLISQLRQQGIKSIEEVDYAILENSGDLSIFQNTKEYPMPIILDGVIDETVIQEIGKDRAWILRLLKQENLPLEDVFYAFYTQKKTFIIKKSDLL